MNKREAVLSLLDESKTPPYVPAAFFLHFDPSCRFGQAAVDKHLEYFRHTGMDLVKIQYEKGFPQQPQIRQPSDWASFPLLGKDFYEEPLGVVEGLVKAAKKEAVVVITLYSPLMCAGHATSSDLITAHLKENPDATKKGLEIITESLMIFVRECIKLGVDGFYASTQGGESGRFTREEFESCVKPFDLVPMEEMNRRCLCNILHVCDYASRYDADLTPYLDYPGHIVSAPLHFTDRTMTPKEVADLFGRPFIGGLDRLGVLAQGPVDAIKAAAEDSLRAAPERFILGADCTVPLDTPWDNLKAAIDTAHGWHKA